MSHLKLVVNRAKKRDLELIDIFFMSIWVVVFGLMMYGVVWSMKYELDHPLPKSPPVDQPYHKDLWMI